MVDWTAAELNTAIDESRAFEDRWLPCYGPVGASEHVCSIRRGFWKGLIDEEGMKRRLEVVEKMLEEMERSKRSMKEVNEIVRG